MLLTTMRQWARSRPLTVVAAAALVCALTVVRVGTSEASPVTTTDQSDTASPGSGRPSSSADDGGPDQQPASTTNAEATTGRASDEPAESSTNPSSGDSPEDGSSGALTSEPNGSGEDAGGGATTGNGSGGGISPADTSTGGSSTADGTPEGPGLGPSNETPGGSTQSSDPWQSNFFADLPIRWGVAEIYVHDAPPYGLDVTFVDDGSPEIGDKVATVKYLGYSCAGTWTLDSRTSTTVVLHEQVDVDTDAPPNRRCAPDATIELERRSTGRIRYEATAYAATTSDGYTVVPAIGTLTPVA